MSTDPRTAGGWFPRLSPSGQHCLSTWIDPHDSSKTASIVDGVVICVGGYGGCWLNEQTVIIQDHATGRLLQVVIGQSLPPQPLEGPLGIGGNVIAAANNALAISRTDPPGPRVLLQMGMVDEELGFVSPALSDSANDYAWLRHEDGALFHHGRKMDARPCREPAFGSETLCYEHDDAKIAGYVTFGQPRVELTIPGLQQYKPIPVWTGRDLVVLSHTQTGVILQKWGERFGWRVYDGITDGPHHARTLDQTHVRCVFSVGGVLQEKTIDLDSTSVDLSAPPAPPAFDVHAEYDVLDFFLGVDGPWPRTGNPGHYLNTDVHEAERWFAHVKSGDSSFAGYLRWDDAWVRLHEDHTNPPFPNYIFTDGRWAPRRVKNGAANMSFRVDGNMRRDWTGSSWAPPVAFPYDMRLTLVAAYDFGVELGVLPALLQDFDNRPSAARDPDTGVVRRHGSWERTVWAYRRGIGRFESWKTPSTGGPDVLEFTSVFNVRSNEPRVIADPPRWPFDVPMPPPVAKPTITIRDDYGPKRGRAPLTWEATAITTGKIDRIVWRYRMQGTAAWTYKDDDQHTTVTLTSPGVYEIGVDCYGPGGADGTTRPRLIVVMP